MNKCKDAIVKEVWAGTIKFYITKMFSLQANHFQEPQVWFRFVSSYSHFNNFTWRVGGGGSGHGVFKTLRKKYSFSWKSCTSEDEDRHLPVPQKRNKDLGTRKVMLEQLKNCKTQNYSDCRLQLWQWQGCSLCRCSLLVPFHHENTQA